MMTQTVSQEQWVALCLITESERPHEWGPVVWVLRNRIADRRYPDTYRDVVLDPYQFSRFNAHMRQAKNLPDGELFEAVMAGRGDRLTLRPLSRGLLSEAEKAARHFVALPEDKAPFGPAVCHYYSPVSMVPGWLPPSWASTAKRLFTPAGINPERFVYAEGVP